MFNWLNSYGANNVVQFSCTIKTKVYAKEANLGWHHRSKGILHIHPYFKREVSVAFLRSVSILFYGHSNLVTYHFISLFWYSMFHQQFFIYVGSRTAHKVSHFPVLSDYMYCFPALNQCLAGDKVSFSRTQHSNSTGGEIRTTNPSIPSLTLYKLSH